MPTCRARRSPGPGSLRHVGQARCVRVRTAPRGWRGAPSAMPRTSTRECRRTEVVTRRCHRAEGGVDPELRHDEAFVALQGCVGTRAPEPGDRRVDDAWVVGGQAFEPEPESVGDAGSERLDQHVGVAGEAEQRVASARCLRSSSMLCFPARRTERPVGHATRSRRAVRSTRRQRRSRPTPGSPARQRGGRQVDHCEPVEGGRRGDRRIRSHGRNDWMGLCRAMAEPGGPLTIWALRFRVCSSGISACVAVAPSSLTAPLISAPGTVERT